MILILNMTFVKFYTFTAFVLYEKSYNFASERKSKFQTVYEIWACEKYHFFQKWHRGPQFLGPYNTKSAWLLAKLRDTCLFFFGPLSRSFVRIWLFFHDLKNYTQWNCREIFHFCCYLCATHTVLRIIPRKFTCSTKLFTEILGKFL